MLKAATAQGWRKGKTVKRAITKVPSILLAGSCVGLLVYGLGCVSEGTRSDGARRTARRHLAAGDYVGAEASYRKAAAWSSDSHDRTKALLGVGISRLERGDAGGALEAFRQAQQINRSETLKPRISRHLGLASMAQGHWNTAQRYLRQSLESTDGEQRENVLARLALCSRKLGQEARALEYESLLKDRSALPVTEILADRDPLVRLATTRAAPQSVQTRRARYHRPGPVPAVARAPDQTPSPGAVLRSPSPVRRGLHVELRNRWGALPRRGNIRRMRHVSRITVHHTAGDADWNLDEHDVAEAIRKIQRYHQTENGWADIGYHYVIDRAGRIWQGREMKWQGAHAGGSANQGNVGIVMLGNYTKQRVNAAQRQSLRTLVSRVSVAFNIPPDRLYTHREIHGKTECPGPYLQRVVDSLRTSNRSLGD